MESALFAKRGMETPHTEQLEREEHLVTTVTYTPTNTQRRPRNTLAPVPTLSLPLEVCAMCSAGWGAKAMGKSMAGGTIGVLFGAGIW